MKTRSLSIFLAALALALALALPPLGQAPVAAAATTPLPVDLSAPAAPGVCRQLGEVIVASPLLTFYVRLPLVQKSLDCSTGESYDIGPAYQTEPPLSAALHPDKNPFGPPRGYVTSTGPTGPVGSGALDPCGWPPQLALLFDTPRNGFPVISTYTFNTLYNPTRPGGPANGLATTMGELIRVPTYACNNLGGNPVQQVLVLYADPNNITIKYTREDNIYPGYAIHLRNICVDPALLTRYNQQEGGRYSGGYLVNLRARQAMGRAASSELIVSVRDQGDFLSPRLCDWWRGYQGCP